jgi:hypothetical protein
MVTPRKDTDLARKRQLAKGVRAVQVAAPLTFVIAPIQELLGTVQSIAGTELRKLAKDTTENPERRMSEGEARKLATLTEAAVKAHEAGARISESDLESMTDEQIETAMLAELERIRAKRKGGTV